jgi:hypothetical protein
MSFLIITHTIDLLIQIRNWMVFKYIGGSYGRRDRTLALADARVICLAQGKDWRVSSPGKFLFFDRAKREDCFPVKLVQDLRQPGVDRGESADQSFITGEMLETRAGIGKVAIGQQEK